jgi:hypothetical protein
MTFYVSVIAAAQPFPYHLKCPNLTKCRIQYRRAYTPTIYYIQPRVTYAESYTEVFFNPANTMTLIKDLDNDEYPFINAKIGGNLIDFEFSEDSESTWSNWVLGSARGQIGENTVAKNQNITMMWETGKSAVAVAESLFCDFANTCYQAKSLPVIYNISEHIGYNTGGQNLTITGYGFDSGTIKATVDGKNCKVTSFGRHEFDCTVESRVGISDLNKPHIGQHGLSRDFINKTTGISYSGIDDEPSEKQLAINLATEYNFGDNLGSIYKAWFYPPKTAKYRFYMVCDDYCQLKIAQCAGSISPMTTLLDLNGWT